MDIIKRKEDTWSINLEDSRKITDMRDRITILEEEIIRLRDKVEWLNKIDFTSLGFHYNFKNE